MKTVFLRPLYALCLLTGAVLCSSCGSDSVSSPDGNVVLNIAENSMTISYMGQDLQTIEMQSGKLLSSGKVTKLDESYEMPFGKRTLRHVEANLRSFDFDSLKMEVRVSNDGVAFRYLNGEKKTAYIIPDGTKRWLGAYSYTGYETLFPASDSTKAGKWVYPALLDYGDEIFGFIAEAGIERSHSCSHLLSGEESGRYEIETIDADPAYEVTPWRFVLVGELAAIVESTMVEDLSAPCALDDSSWIKPGVSSWIYWAYNHGSKDFGIICSYIDLAAEMGWPYCLVDWEWPDMEGGKTIEDVMQYADEKGIRINLWYNSGTSWVGEGAPQPEDRLRTAEAREQEFSWLESLGVAGVKVDFFSEDGSEMVNYYLDILEDAARHHLLVDFHGSTIPRGWQRTYPNLMSMEAVWGAEWYNNVPFFTPVAASHNATLPFTRNLMGPMDYTPCTFTDSQHPHITTDAHELALTVLFQSSLQNMADRPEAYLGQSGEVRSFLSGLPAVWDDTRLISGYPGESAVMARQKDGVWYIAGINGTDEPMTFDIDLVKLKLEKDCTFELITDGDEGLESSTINGLYNVIDCLPRGGFVMKMK